MTARRSKEPFSFLVMAQVVTVMWFSMVFLAKIVTLHFSPLIDYQVGEWLVNYSQGLVRRGLAGEIAMRLSAATGVDAVILLKLMGGSSVAAFLWIFIRRVAAAPGLSRNERFGLLFMPTGVSFVLLNPQAILRKDYVAFVAFFAVLALVERPGPPRLWRIGALLAAAGSLAILVHEVFLLLFVPYLVLLLWARLSPPPGGRWKAALQIAALLAVPCVVALAILSNNPRPGTAYRMCTDAQQYAHSLKCTPLPKALTFIDMGQESAFAISYNRLIREQLWGLPSAVWWIVIYLPFGWLHYEVLWRILRAQLGAERENDARFTAAGLCIFNAGLIVAMSAVGFDVGRWIFMVTALATVSAASPVCAQSLSSWFTSLPVRGRLPRLPAMRSSLYLPCLLAAAFCSHQFHIPHCCFVRLLDLFWFVGDIHDYLYGAPEEPLALLTCLGMRCF